MPKTKVKIVDESDFKAPPGKFRVIAKVESRCYLAEDDQDTFDKAVAIAMNLTEHGHIECSVYDDTGKNRL